ncbi:MAG: hypothetical protein VX278_09940, partial [Myxococcota bacterium]|nr:hypothetical protein [Myxococcota bacterium]
IALFLEKNQIQHSVREQHNVIMTYFETETYLNRNEENHMQILIIIEKSGRSIQFIVPHCYSASNTINKSALFEAILNINWENRIVQYRYDVKDGEIRVGLSYPLEDAHPSEKQVLASLFLLINTVNKYHPTLIGALQDDPIHFPEHEKERVNLILDSLFEEQNLTLNPTPDQPKITQNDESDSSEDEDVWL